MRRRRRLIYLPNGAAVGPLSREPDTHTGSQRVTFRNFPEKAVTFMQLRNGSQWKFTNYQAIERHR